jgi:PAS domain S-box-containing protein
MAALRGDPVADLIAGALALCREVLGVDQAAVVRAEAAGETFVLDAVEPPRPDLLGRVVVRSGDRSQAGQTLALGAPIVVPDRRVDGRFDVVVAGDQDVVSAVTVVIPTATGPFGVLGLYHGAPWPVPDEDLEFVTRMAAVIGTAVDRRRTERALEASNTRLRMAQEASRMGVWEWDLRTGKLLWSEALEHLYGLPTGGFTGTLEDFERLVHPGDLDEVRRQISTALRNHRYELEHRIVRADSGAVHWIVARGEVVRDQDGEPVRMVGINIDITERRLVDEERTRLLAAERAARAAAEQAQERLALLSDATAALSASLDYAETLRSVTGLVVPEYADLCVVNLEEGGRLRTVAMAHHEPEGERLLARLAARYPTETAGGGTAPIDPRTPEPVVYPEVDDALLRSLAVDAEHLEMLRALQVRSSILVPLTARGRVLGGLWLSRCADREPFDAREDVALITELGQRAALAIDNARLFSEVTRTGERFRRMAETLQASLLPPTLPTVPGVDLAATYRAAAVGTTVGGDFYDVFGLAERGWGLVMGDVQGKGTEAASLTAIARHTLRTAAIRHDAAASLATLNNVLLSSDEHADKFCTVLYGELEPFEGGVRLQLASGGHPPALVRRAATGRIHTAGGGGTLMGVLTDAPVNVETVTLYPGDVLVLYTDGVTEAWGDAGEFGEAGLRAALEPPAGSAEEYVAMIDAVVTTHSEGRLRDDVAILAVRVP